ncbi:MAG TPA: nucleotide sugar dehydrogenase [Candidatus Nitrosotalea sp.]|nr:nucleotide sugar dehydrogenase [Candidatus Nitrosotalea sp.]
MVSNHDKVFSIYGLGNVGGPIAAAWLRAGAKIVGVDISKKLLSEIESGTSHKKEPFLSETFTAGLKSGGFSVTSDGVKASKMSDIKIVAVPVDLSGNKIRLEALKSASKNIAQGLKKGDAVLICPSMPPGTCERTVLPILEKYSKLKGGKDFLLIYNPERIYEGRALQDIEENYPAVVAGLGEESKRFGEELLKIISKKGVITMSSIANAEAEKIFEGVYRDVNIALANELADFCERMGVNYWEARKAANSQPFCHLHYPGTGVGGLCIPVYPKFVIESASKTGKHLRITEFARKLNDSMPIKCVNDSIDLLSKHKIRPKGAKVAVLGLGFRGEVEDSRLSPTYTVVKEFLKRGCKVAVHDPYILEDGLLPSSVTLSSNLDSVVENASLVFVSSDHKAYYNLDQKSLGKAREPLLVFDGRNILKKENFRNGSLLTIGMRELDKRSKA